MRGSRERESKEEWEKREMAVNEGMKSRGNEGKKNMGIEGK